MTSSTDVGSDKESVESAEQDAGVTARQQNGVDATAEDVESAEQGISLSISAEQQDTIDNKEDAERDVDVAGPSFKEFILTPKKARRCSATKRRVGHAEVITTSPYKKSLVASKTGKKRKLSQSQDHQRKQRNVATKKNRMPTASTSKDLSNTTDDRTPCMYCEILYCESTVQWYKCKSCGNWACATCARVGHKRRFMCANCK